MCLTGKKKENSSCDGTEINGNYSCGLAVHNHDFAVQILPDGLRVVMRKLLGFFIIVSLLL